MASAATAPRPDALHPLDARELEIAALMVQGHSTPRVAARLYSAPKTLRNRVSAIVAKLGVGTRDEVFELARAAGWAGSAAPEERGDRGAVRHARG